MTKLEKGRPITPLVRVTASAGAKPTEAAGSFPGRVTRLLIPFLIFLSAFLLFQVQLIIGKYLLPWFGGTASVWTTCLLAFQVLLLAGYGYAHASARLGQRQAKIHAALLLISVGVLAVLAVRWETPITPGASLRPTAVDDPVGSILLVLAITVAAPFFLLSTTTPLLQSWCRAYSPNVKVYRLYALSNLGSLLGLLSYPFVVEPHVTLSTQAWVWSGSYVVFALGTAVSALLVRPTVAAVKPARDSSAEKATVVQRLMWVALAACGTGLLLAVTNFISQDLAVVPLIWVLPLALYLLSFVITFENSRFYHRTVAYIAVALAMAAMVHVLFRGGFFPVVAAIWILCGVLLAGCFLCHGELAKLKPAPQYLTSFYLSVAAGGALGTAIVGLLAPYFFSDLWELPFALGFCGLLAVVAQLSDSMSWMRRNAAWKVVIATLMLGILPLVISLYLTIDMSQAWLRNCLILATAYGIATIMLWVWRRKWEQAMWPKLLLAGGVPITATVLFILGMDANLGHLLARERNFYGVLSVWERSQDDPIQHSYELYHGRVLHGLQLRNPEYRRRATSYYGNQTGAGLALKYHARRWSTSAEQATLRVGAVGLGVGTIALYAVSGDYFRFYELNPAIAQLSRGDDPYFSYLRDCRGKTDIVLGDARLSLEREAERGELQQFDVLVLDAFSGDAIPVHLLTREAFEIYFKHLRDQNSVIAVHITNRVVDLAPVVSRLAYELGLNGVRIHTQKHGDFLQRTEWILLSRASPVLRVPQVSSEVQPLEDSPSTELWTDDYSNVFSLLK